MISHYSGFTLPRWRSESRHFQVRELFKYDESAYVCAGATSENSPKKDAFWCDNLKINNIACEIRMVIQFYADNTQGNVSFQNYIYLSSTRACYEE